MRKKLLRAEGFKVGRRHVRTLMRKMGIEALYRKKNTSRRHPGHEVFPYLLGGRTITEANQVWALDIPYIPMARGFVYFVGVMDWATRRILSWRLSTTLTTDFCVEALEDAISRYGKPEVVNTDQSLPPRKRGAASSRVRRSSISCTATESLSAWTARVFGRTALPIGCLITDEVHAPGHVGRPRLCPGRLPACCRNVPPGPPGP